MAALLAERPADRLTAPAPARRADGAVDTDSGWLRRLRERRADAAAGEPTAAADRRRAAVRLDPAHAAPRAARPARRPGDAPLSAAALGGDTVDAGTVAPSAGAYAGARRPTARPGRWDSGDRDGRSACSAPADPGLRRRLRRPGAEDEEAAPAAPPASSSACPCSRWLW